MPRERTSKTIEDAAALLRVDGSTISRYETGGAWVETKLTCSGSS
jgi:predicted transcriptional regulator